MIGIKVNTIVVSLGATLATWGVILVGEAKAIILQPQPQVIGPSLTFITDEVSSPGSSFAFQVDNPRIENQSGQTWNGFRLDLEVLNSTGQWVPSDNSDGISFDQSNTNWANTVVVKINDITQSGWRVTRTNSPFDVVTFGFDSFVVSPGQTLSLGFDMLNVKDNTWGLRQRALVVSSVPVPESSPILGMALLGAFGIASVLKRKQ